MPLNYLQAVVIRCAASWRLAKLNVISRGVELSTSDQAILNSGHDKSLVRHVLPTPSSNHGDSGLLEPPFTAA